MGENSKIEWCDHTFNPWIGCTKVSPGCANCYAESLSNRYGWAKWGKGNPRHRTSEANWRKPIKWNRDVGYARACPVSGDENYTERVFCASLSDWLDDEIQIEWLADLLELIEATPNLTWLLLTKRPQNFEDRIAAAANILTPEGPAGYEPGNIASEWLSGDAPENVWVGTTVEDQKRADARIPLLVKIPAKVRFLSCEPLLGRVSIRQWMWREETARQFPEHASNRINWVICGGESGPGCRPMEIEWAESLAEQCIGAGASFFMKQLGGGTVSRHSIEDFPPHLRIREFPVS